MNRLLGYFMIILFAGVIVSCGDDEDVAGPITEQSAGTKALSSLSGTTGTVTSVDEDTTSTNEIYYDVDVITDAGAVLEFEYYQADGALKSIEGDNGPFDYEVDPGMGLIKFSTAKAAALEAITAMPGEVLLWDLEFDNSDNMWIYTFEVRDANGDEWTILINASSGAVLQ